MASRQEFPGEQSGKTKMSKQLLGVAGGVALGLLALYGAACYTKYLERSRSQRKPREIGMSAPPARAKKEASKDSSSSSPINKESQQEHKSGSQQHDDKDGKAKVQGSQAGQASSAMQSTIVQDEKVPEQGFDAPEDKMQEIGMSWKNNGQEVVIEALCPKDLQPKDLKCNFTTNTLLLEVAGKQIAVGKLSGPIKPDECTWQFGDEHLKNPMADSKSLTVTLVKSSNKKWKELFSVPGPAGLE